MSKSIQFRNFTIGDNAIDESTRSVEVCFFTDTPCSRGSYDEILDPSGANLSRLNTGGAALLQHDPERMIGVVEDARVVGRKGRARIRFDSHQLAEEVWQGVKSGIRKLVSCGYIVNDAIQEWKNGREVMRVTDYIFTEISFVSLPLDPECGVGRALDGPKPKLKSSVKIMSENTGNTALEERDRAKAILLFASSFESYEGVRSIAEKAIVEGTGLDDAKAAIVRHAESVPEKFERVRLTELPSQDRHRYSLSRAILGAAEGRLSGLEGEMSREIERNLERATSGVYVPFDAMGNQTRAAWDTATSGAASELVGTDLRPDAFIERLRPQSLALSLGVQVLENLRGNVAVPRHLSSVTASWEGETSQVAQTWGTVDQLQLSPNRLSTSTSFSLQLLRQGAPGVDGLLTSDIMAQFGTAVDAAVFEGSGSGEPTGITAGATASSSIASAGAPSWAEILEFESDVATANGDVGSMAYVTTPAVRGNMKAQRVDSGSGTFVWGPDNRVNGYAAYASNNISSNRIIFGNFRDYLLCMWGGVELIPDNVTQAREAIINLTAHSFYDGAVRHGASFSVSA